MRFTFRLLAAVAAVALSVGVANAVPITTMGGTFGNGSSTSTSATFTNGSITASTPSNPSIIGATSTNLTINGLGTLSSLGFGVNIGPANLASSTFTLTVGANTAVFSMTSPFTLVSSTPNVGIVGFTTSAVLLSNTIPGVDLSQFTLGGGGGVFTFSGNGVYANAGSPGSFINPGNGAITGSFSLTSNASLATPEPASLAVFGVLALGGLAAARRKFLAKRETV